MTVQTYAALAEVVRSRPARLGGVRLVAVDGPSGAGKTHFATRLAAACPPGTPVVHTDDLLDGWDDQLTFWPRLVRLVLDPLRCAVAARYRCYDWTAGRFGDRWVTVPPAGVVLIEGVSAARAQLRPELSLSVFVTAPEPVRLARSLARDGVAAQSYLESWRRAERAHFAADGTARHADLVVDAAADGHDPAHEYVRLHRPAGRSAVDAAPDAG